jgi:hypothetical protein
LDIKPVPVVYLTVGIMPVADPADGVLKVVPPGLVEFVVIPYVLVPNPVHIISLLKADEKEVWNP